jgi:hypothetical protein
MWWFLALGAAVTLLFACALYAEFGPGAGKKVRAREASTSTNYAMLHALSNGRRNQTSGR